MKNSHSNRRDFIKKSAIVATGLGFSAKSYARIIGSNERVNIAVAGLNSRGNAHLSAARTFAKEVNIVGLCDVDNRVFDKVKREFSDFVPGSTKTYSDIRKMLEEKSIDAVSIATPDHWHTPMAIMAMNAGKHVYLEKPCSHNAHEGEMLIAVKSKTGKVIQIGNQQRSAPTSIELIQKIREGVIGEAYYAKAFYEANRGGIGKGASAAVPEWLDWDLWQGPAPREDYKDNFVHYNWHWFWKWGTGEINNNGLHEMDICRWALDVGMPTQVSSAGGRFAFDDDWEFYDTQLTTFNFSGGKMLNWEGRSCNGTSVFKNAAGRGSYIHGTKGTAFVDREGYEIFDLKNNLIEKSDEAAGESSVNTLGISGLDNFHYRNFLNGIQKGEQLNSPVEEAHKSTLLCHLGNMSQHLGKALMLDEKTGKPKDKEAMKMWSREYEKGWKPIV
ncbi:MAG: putative dehydrogenase [Spirosomataceae bacterium]|jgi:predicted dehydrogenase